MAGNGNIAVMLLIFSSVISDLILGSDQRT